MSSIHIAKKIQPTSSGPAPFIARKLHHLAPAPISSVGVSGVTHYREVAYGNYKCYIDAFVAATIKNEKIYALLPAFFDYYESTQTLPFDIHPVAFSPVAKLSTDQQNKVLANMGEGATIRVIGQSLEFTVPKMSMVLNTKVLKMADPNFGVGPGRLTPIGFTAYQKVSSIIAAFLATNYYPAYKTLEEVPSHDLKIELALSGPVNQKKKEFFYSYTDNHDEDADEVVLANSVKRRKLELKKEGDEEDSEMEEDDSGSSVKKTYGVMSYANMDNAVIVAKPSGRPPSVNFGPAGSVPSYPGVVFPYFPGMTTPDEVTVRDVMITHFFGLFGSTNEEAQTNLQEIKRGIASLVNTEGGRQMTHAMKGISLSLETQTRLYLVFEREKYEGFVLLGGGFSVWDSSRWVHAASAETVKKELYKLDTHMNALTEIAEILSGLKMVDTSLPDVDISVEDLSSAFRIMTRIKERKVKDLDDKGALDRALQSLVWDQKYLQITPENVELFLGDVQSESVQSIIDFPFYIPGCLAPLHDHKFLKLARFGPDAPSFWNSRGDRLSLLPPRSDSGKRRNEDVEVECPKEVIVLPKPVLVAYKDLKSVLDQGAVSFNVKERAKEHRAHVIASDKYRKSIWSALCRLANDVDSSKKAEKSVEKKQKIVDTRVLADADAVLAMFD